MDILKKQLKISLVIICISSFSCNEKKIIENVNIENVKSDDKFGLTENQRKELFKDIVKVEDKINVYKHSKEDSILNLNLDKIQLKKKYEEIEIQSAELLKKHKLEIIKNYKISEDEEKQISFEGLNKNWPLE